jgi:hypothetical protein
LVIKLVPGSSDSSRGLLWRPRGVSKTMGTRVRHSHCVRSAKVDTKKSYDEAHDSIRAIRAISIRAISYCTYAIRCFKYDIAISIRAISY